MKLSNLLLPRKSGTIKNLQLLSTSGIHLDRFLSPYGSDTFYLVRFNKPPASLDLYRVSQVLTGPLRVLTNSLENLTVSLSVSTDSSSSFSLSLPSLEFSDANVYEP